MAIKMERERGERQKQREGAYLTKVLKIVTKTKVKLPTKKDCYKH